MDDAQIIPSNESISPEEMIPHNPLKTNFTYELEGVATLQKKQPDEISLFRSPLGKIFTKEFIVFQCLKCQAEITLRKAILQFDLKKYNGIDPMCLICPYCICKLRVLVKEKEPDSKFEKGPKYIRKYLPELLFLKPNYDYGFTGTTVSINDIEKEEIPKEEIQESEEEVELSPVEMMIRANIADGSQDKLNEYWAELNKKQEENKSKKQTTKSGPTIVPITDIKTELCVLCGKPAQPNSKYCSASCRVKYCVKNKKNSQMPNSMTAEFKNKIDENNQ